MLGVIKQALQEASQTSKPVTMNDKNSIHLNKINVFLQKNEYIMNSDVQKLLDVSSATATRILTNLSKSGALKKVRINSHWGYTRK